MKIIKSLKDVKDIKFGEQVIVDVLPVDPEELMTADPSIFEKEQEILDAIDEQVAKQLKDMAELEQPVYMETVQEVNKEKYKGMTKTKLNKMKEKELVAIAKELGLAADVKDLKKDTVAKIYNYLKK